MFPKKINSKKKNNAGKDSKIVAEKSSKEISKEIVELFGRKTHEQNSEKKIF